MKKVLVITSNFPRYDGDSLGWFIHEIDKRLNNNGFNMYVLAPHNHNAKFMEVIDGVKVSRFSYFYPYSYQKLAYGNGIPYNIKRSHLAKIQVPLFFCSELFNSIQIIKKEDIDIIHSHWLLPSGLVGAICSRIFDIPHIATIHGSDVNTIKKSKILRIICSFIIKNSDIITTNSSYTKNILLLINNNIENKVKIIPMGTDINYFRLEDNKNLKECFKAKYLILSVGRLVELKGIRYLIIAMKDLIRNFPKAKLVIVGDGPEKEKLEKLTESLSLKDNVIFEGYIKNFNLHKYYASSDVFVLPSITINGQSDGLGVVLLEAMACSTPVIGTAAGGLTDIIKHNYNGFLIPEKSSRDLADSISELLTNESLAKKFRENGLKTIKEKFSWNHVIEEFHEIYEQVIEENHKNG
ncbi:MAG: glycosyltransferase family 4 protein [Candidatus Methanoperedens sp.]|nr:glycosyltransferase family 4 protein [Candidatus Methanoperedens sp.]MCZ7403905.1 glycosyltransferase family 4 protein [Candidatus Methanoperedens sp.]